VRVERLVVEPVEDEQEEQPAENAGAEIEGHEGEHCVTPRSEGLHAAESDDRASRLLYCLEPPEHTVYSVQSCLLIVTPPDGSEDAHQRSGGSAVDRSAMLSVPAYPSGPGIGAARCLSTRSPAN
jgi:hypothetical protein